MQTVPSFHIRGTPRFPRSKSFLPRTPPALTDHPVPSRPRAWARPRGVRRPRPHRPRPDRAPDHGSRARAPVRRARPRRLRAEVALRPDGGAGGRRVGCGARHARPRLDRPQRGRRRAQRTSHPEMAAREGIVWLPTVDAENEAHESAGLPPGEAASVAAAPERVRRARHRRRLRARCDGRRRRAHPRRRLRRGRAARPRARDRPPRRGGDRARRRRGTRRGHRHDPGHAPGLSDAGRLARVAAVGVAERGALLERCFAAPDLHRQGLVGTTSTRSVPREPSTTSSRPISASRRTRPSRTASR